MQRNAPMGAFRGTICDRAEVLACHVCEGNSVTAAEVPTILVTTHRINYQQAAPDVLQAIYASEKAVHASTLEPKLLNLVQLRASQINKCAFCLALHGMEADALGEKRKRLDVLPAWREAADWFTPRERAALEWTETLTLVADERMPEDVYDRAAEQFSPNELATLTLAVATINTWNRFNVAFDTSPGAAEAVFRRLHPTPA